MAMKSIIPALPVEDPKGDYRSGEKVGVYRFGREALYFPAFPSAQYLPLAAVERAWVQKSAWATKGCCGAQLPIYVLRVAYRGGFFQNFTFDRPQDADRALSLVAARRPDISLEPETRRA